MRHLLAAAGLLLASSALAQDSIFPSKEQKEMARHIDPAAITDESRRFLKGKMKNHSKELRDLSLAVATLDFPKAGRLSQELANQPRLDPAAGPSSKLPEGFFALQNLLKQYAQNMADAARAGEADKLVDQYQYAITVCAACHASFMLQVKGAAK